MHLELYLSGNRSNIKPESAVAQRMWWVETVEMDDDQPLCKTDMNWTTCEHFQDPTYACVLADLCTPLAALLFMLCTHPPLKCSTVHIQVSSNDFLSYQCMMAGSVGEALLSKPSAQ
jgi:hypothetical protein